MQRRQFIHHAAGLGLGAAALGTGSLVRAAQAPLKIGFIYSGPVADVGWTYQHDLGRKMVEAEFGPKVKTVFVENVPEGPDAERVIRQLADDGCTMIFTTSFGFMDPTIRVAADYPDVAFEHCSGYKTAANVGIYQTRFYEGAYLVGMLAGKRTKSNTLGYVAPFPIPEVIRNLNAFVLGARAVNPKASARVVWINSWYDPPKERDAALALMNQGADVMYQNTDSPAIVQLAQSKGLWAIGQDSDMARFGPNAQLSANTLNWGVYYVHKVRQRLAGQWKPEDTKWGMKEGIVKLAALGPSVPKEVLPQFEDRRGAIVAGKFHPFAGPIAEQGGKPRIASGQVLPEADLWQMKWYVDGIVGKQP
ncbi:BMP family ABC transporter substrate-binding protein [Paucibacter sp. R3-3]|uniref:BMP family ABC transporter substrate-binding protein n=1 Tax=Roseateles agri TaxID=3098619 RepID=A0ABU5DH06_9BURK|nr:BMP family ABC transporter substrate-binding protein [Paucibacter sp. R3-3]MDY0744990.1 BMP family ABC transporter substrate-binding protein [Paucibacter sp. R3-3]